MQLSFNCHSNTAIQLSCHSTVIQLSFKHCHSIELSFNCHSIDIQIQFSCRSKSIQIQLWHENDPNVTSHSQSIQCQLSLEIHSMSTATPNRFNFTCHSKYLQCPNWLNFTCHSKSNQFHTNPPNWLANSCSDCFFVHESTLPWVSKISKKNTHTHNLRKF